MGPQLDIFTYIHVYFYILLFQSKDIHFIICIFSFKFHEAIGLLEALLTFDSKKRVTAEEVLSHPYFEEYSCPEDEPVAAWTFHIEHEVRIVANFFCQPAIHF